MKVAVHYDFFSFCCLPRRMGRRGVILWNKRNRAMIFDQNGCIVSMAQKEFPQIFPKPGWVEHDPEDIWNSQIDVAKEAMLKAGLTAEDIAALGIANQRFTMPLFGSAVGLQSFVMSSRKEDGKNP